MATLTRPILIGGPGKSGTTLLLRLMATHPELAWFSGWTNRFPQWPIFSALSRVNDIPAIERRTRDVRRWPHPAEAYGVWDHYFPGFSAASHDWTKNELAEDAAGRMREVMRAHLKWQGKSRFLTKYTGWPRFSFMRALAADAELLYIDRDPRAVVYSYERYQWWHKDRPEVLAAMSPRNRIDFFTGKYLAYFRAKQQAQRDQPILQVNYEPIVEDPQRKFAELCERLGLSFPASFSKSIASYAWDAGRNDAWRKKLSAEDGRYLTEKLEEPIRSLGYTP